MSQTARRWRSRLAVALASAFAVCCATPILPVDAAPTSAPAAGYGFSMYGGDVQLSAQDLNRELAAVNSTTASWVRVIFDAFRIETAPGEFDWSQADLLVDAARAHGLNVLVTLTFSPSWARAPGTQWSAPPDDPATFAQFAAAVVSRYEDRVRSWEIWNEPNEQRFFTTDGDPAAQYTAILKATYIAIKRVQPDSTVIAGGLSRTGQIPPPTFVERMYRAGAGGYFDAAAMHPYVSPGGLAADSYNGWSDVGRIHGVMADHGDAGKRIWMTEFGAPTIGDGRGVSEVEQAKQITDVLAAAAATGYSGPAFIFTIRDMPGRSGDPEYSYGALLTADWQPKATAKALALEPN